jgi:nitrite reductase/ring-hydroxylating ferredoxin subunit
VNSSKQCVALEIPADKVVEDQPYQVKLGKTAAIAIYRVADAFYAVDDVCTHEFAYLSEGYCEAGVIECPLHQARFDVTTGATLGPPAAECLARYRTEVSGAIVRVYLPADLARLRAEDAA